MMQGVSVECIPLDLASLENVRAFAARFATLSRPPIIALICNAGIQVVSGRPRSVDGYELTFAVNHLAHFLLANLLLPQMSAASRILFVSSGTHDPVIRTGLPPPQWSTANNLATIAASAEPFATAGRRAYSTSKLCNIMCSYEFSRRLSAAGLSIASIAFDPGMMPGTGLARDYPPALRFLWHTVLRIAPLFSDRIRTVTRSAHDLARLAIDPAYQDASGRYYSGIKPIASSEESYNRERALDLWSTSVRLARLTQAESPLTE
jgi:NAD(P)-dependent dehydrogenase (short-subunit alcohol dehydrogenase family)